MRLVQLSPQSRPLIVSVVVASFPPFAFSKLFVAVPAAKVLLSLVFFVEFVSPVPCLSAIVAVVFNGLVQLPTGVGNPSVTVVPVVRPRPRSCCKEAQRAQHDHWPYLS